MTNNPGTGNIATGEIRLDTAGLVTDARAIIDIAKSIEAVFKQVDDAVKRTEQTANSSSTGIGRLADRFEKMRKNIQMEKMNPSDLGRISQGLDTLARNWALASAAAGGYVAVGLQAARQIQNLNMMLGIWSGGQEKANARMQELRAIADRTGQSFLSVANAANAILPAVGRYNVDLGVMLSLVQRLAVLDPIQGTAGAAYAIRELLSGTTRSLAGRFELSNTELRKIVDAAGGDPAKIIEGLDKLVNKLGLTREAFEEMGRSGINAFERLSGTLQELLGRAMLPILQHVLQPMADGFANLLNWVNMNDVGILQLGASLAWIVTMIAPVTYGISKAISAFDGMAKAIKSVNAASAAGGLAGNLTKWGSRAVVAGAVLPPAINLGERIVQALGDASAPGFLEGFSRYSTENLQKRNTTVETEMTAILLQTLGILVKVLGEVIVVFNDLWAAIRMGGEVLAWLFTEEIPAIIEQLNSALKAQLLKAAGDIAESLGLTQNAEQLRGMAVLEQLNANAVEQRRYQSAHGVENNSLDNRINGIAIEAEGTNIAVRNAIANVLGVIVEELNRITPVVEAEAGSAQAVFAELGAAIGAAATSAKGYLDQIADLNAEFDKEQAKIDDKRWIDDNREMEDFNIKRLRDFNKWQNDLMKLDAEYAAEKAQRTADYYANLAAMDADYMANRTAAIEDYDKQAERRLEDHNKRLQQINEDMMLAVQEAAFKLDATGVWEALRQGAKATADENSSFKTAEDRNQADFQEQLALADQQHAEQMAQLTAQYEAQNALAEEQYLARRDAMVADFEERTRLEDEDRALRLQRLQEDRDAEDYIRWQAHQEKINDLIQQWLDESNLWSAANATISLYTQQARQYFIDLAAEVALAAQRAGEQAGFDAGYPGAPPSPYTPPPNSGYVPLPPPGNYWQDGVYYPRPGGPGIPMYADGGRAPGGYPVWVGEFGPEMVMFDQPATVYSAADSRRMAGRMGAANIQVTNNFSDLGRYSEAQIAGMVERALMDVFVEVDARL